MDEKDLMEFGEYLFNTKKLSERTLTLYLDYYKMIDLDILPNQEYINAFIQDHKNNSVVRAMMLNLLKFKALHKTFDMPDRATGKKKTRLIRPISHDEIEKLSRDLHNHSFKQGLIFDLIYQGALRRAEIPTIKINSFQWIVWSGNPHDFCKLIVLGKGNKERTVLINPETTQSILAFYFLRYPDLDINSFANREELLFTTKKGEQITEKIVYNVIKQGSKKSLGRDVRPHELRHCRASELEKRGIQIKDIKNYLGHSNLSTTEMYLHRSESESLNAIKDKLSE